jgi:PadR family transcriptional regulator PadR
MVVASIRDLLSFKKKRVADGSLSRRLDLPRRICDRHDRDYPCTCAMGNLYRFVEPVVLLLLKEKGRSYGYDLSADLQQHALTDAEIERAALYRTLRQLEKNGNVVSHWDTEKGGPARRIYRLTARGERHLEEWAAVLDHVSKSMSRFVKEVRTLGDGKNSPKPKTA